MNTMLYAAKISPVNNGSWQDQSIWPSGQLPSATDEVTIPAGFSIDLTGNIDVKSITINGTLRASSGASIQLGAEWIMVSGSNALFEIGTPANPFDAAHTCTITLKGTDDGDDIMGMGDKFIVAMSGGNIEFHGAQKTSWSKLGATALNGSNQITMAEPVDWAVGDEIVLVSSRPNWEEAEQKTIAAISGDGLTITLNNNLTYPHAGFVETYTRNTDNKTWAADLRAEVGLLTHNVKIQGDASSETGGFGGHIMAKPNSTINASSIELYRMGQKAKLARYPWHWHLLHEFGAGQYFINSSVHRSFNRAITIHGTSYVNVENNFFYDHIGHGVFLEDGSERYNTIKNNVALLSKRPQPGEELTPSDNEMNEVQNRTPATFWITNPNNIFEGNVAAGTEGTGYWFSMPQAPMGSSANNPRYAGIEPYKEPLGLFKNNTAHSCMSGFDIFDQLNPDHSIRKNAGWQNSDQHLIEGCTWYANSLALYTGIGGGVGDKVDYSSNLIFLDNVLVDNVTAMQFASYAQVQESVFVANTGTGIWSRATSLYRIYDGAGQVRNCHLVGWRDANTDYLKDGGAATKHTNHRISGITTDDGLPPAVHFRDYHIPASNTNFTPQSLSHPRVWSNVLYDEDGSFSGVPNSSIVSNHPMMLFGDEFQHPNWVNAYRSPHKFALSLLQFPGLASANIPNLTCTRTKTGTPTASVYYIYGYKDHIQLPFIVSEDFLYSYQFESLPSTRSFNVGMDDAEAGDRYLIRFQDFGKLGGLNMVSYDGPLPEYTTMNDLTNSNETAFLREPNGDLYVNLVATQHLQGFNINWSTDFAVPILDTDEDGVSDQQEIIDGIDPFEEVIVQFDPQFVPIPASYNVNSPNPHYALDINYDDIDIDKQLFHIFVPDTTGNFPLVIHYHGGGFIGGTPNVLGNSALLAQIKYYLDRGVAFASVGYRLLETTQIDPDGVLKCLNDSKRGLQFIRYYSDELYIDPERVALRGNSAGSSTSFWLASRSDMADPNASDPVLRESTRVCAASLNGCQASLDFYKWETEVFNNYDGQGSNYTLEDMENQLGFDRASSFYGGFDSTYQILYDPVLIQYRQDVDMLYHLSADDPPLYVTSNSTAIHPSQDLFHHPFHGRVIQEAALAVNLSEVKASIPALSINTTGGEDPKDFLIRHLNNCSLMPPAITLDAKIFLQGPYDDATGLMSDNLRNTLLPIAEPYEALGFSLVNSGGETFDNNLRNVTGNDAIVDWVLVELRDKNDPSVVLATQSALLQRDGDIVSTDGISSLSFRGLTPDAYYITINHRNHISVTTATTIDLSSTLTTLDFSDGTTPTAGTNAQVDLGNNVWGLYAGDATADDQINAADRSETWNSRNQIGYLTADVDMDGSCNAGDRSIAWNNRNTAGQLP